MKKLAAEMTGSFLLVFISILVVILQPEGATNHSFSLPVVYAVSLFVVTLIFGRISGAHVNPAITIGFWTTKQFPSSKVFPYIASQIVGALLAAYCLLLINPRAAALAFPVTVESAGMSFLAESGFSLLLMFSLLAFGERSYIRRFWPASYLALFAGLSLALFSSATSVFLNPLRWVAAAVISGNFANAWIFFLAPCLGSAASYFYCKFIGDSECCSQLVTEIN